MMEKEINMEKQSCDSMTTVTVKDFNPQLDYQEPPPAYKPMKTSPMVQVAKIVAIAAVAIAGMLSFAIVFSAWLTNSSCQQQLQQMQQKHHQQIIAQQQQQQQQQPPSFEALIQNPESLRNLLALSSGPIPSSLLRERKGKEVSQEEGNDLDSAESKTETNNSKSDSSSEEDDENNSGEDAVTMLRLPVELNFQEHMFERNHRSHMNCIIEKKKAEEIVDEQSKPLPALLGINMSTDPRYLHFTGEKMAISCDSGNEHRQPPPPPSPRDMPYGMDGMMVPPPPPRGHHHHHGLPHPIPIPFGLSSSSGRDSPLSSAQSLASAIAAASSSSVPIQIIGPIPLSSSSSQLDSSPSGPGGSNPFGPGGSNPLFGELGLSAQMIPILLGSSQGGNTLEDLPLPSGQGNSESIFLGPYVAPNSHPNSPPHHHHHTLHYQPHPLPPSAPQHSSLEAQFPFLPASGSSHPFQFSPAGPAPAQHQSAEIRERAVPHPIPIMPRAHVQHVIRPRSVDALVKKRVKRCACDCACKNHQE